MRERQLNNNGTFGDAGCVHMFGGNGGKIQGRELVGIAPGMHPGEIGLRGEFAGRNVDGEGLALKNGVIGPTVLADGNGDARRLRGADASPCGGHDIGTAGMVIRTYEEYWSRKNECFCTQRLEHMMPHSYGKR